MKRASIILVLVLCMCCFMGCNKQQENNLADVMQENDDGTLSYVETENSPLSEEIQITVDKIEKFVEVQINYNDKEKEEYYKFTPENSICLKYESSSISSTYYYYYNYKDNVIDRIEDVNHKDVTTSAKYAGKYEQVQSQMKNDIEMLEEYFENTFGMSIDETLE